MAEVVRILIVTDGSGGFRHDRFDEFHLGEFVHVLQTTQWQGFELQITKAIRGHYGTPGHIGADLANFDFSSHDLSQYDEILLFAVLPDNASISTPPGSPQRSSNATDAEIAALARFMDAGGGVFATGDHEDLGAGLCKRLPRVRNMRRWYWDTPGPNGEPIAPRGTMGVAPQALSHTDAELVDRHDTLVAGHDFDPARPKEHYQFGDQSDNVAQEIIPRMFETRNYIYIRQHWPHPLLCSPDGMVRHLPDHAHEGQCEAPANLGLRVTVGTYDEEEYPRLPDGTRLSPVVVADAIVTGGHATAFGDTPKPPVNGKTFGVIGAYDGHYIERGDRRLGRVVVDATWHHFFNVNLIGMAGAGRDYLGFYSPLKPGQPDHYRMIKHYFRNIIYWLIPAHRWRWLGYHSLAMTVQSGQFYELSPVRRFGDLARMELTQLFALGKLADAYFRRAHGACWRLQFLPRYLYEFGPLRRFWERFDKYIDPWIKVRDPREPEHASLPVDMLTDALLGGMLMAVLKAHAELGIGIGERMDAEQLQRSFAAFEKQIEPSLVQAFQLFGSYLDGQQKQLQELREAIKELE